MSDSQGFTLLTCIYLFFYRPLTTDGRIFKQWQQQELNPWAVLMKSRDSIGNAAFPANNLFYIDWYEMGNIIYIHSHEI